MLRSVFIPLPPAGVDMLRSGGSAVDAAIATALCQGIHNPMASGVGGGHFMLIRWVAGHWGKLVGVGPTLALLQLMRVGRVPVVPSKQRCVSSPPCFCCCRRQPNGTAECIDAREVAPAAANETMYLGTACLLACLFGCLPACSPGQLA